MITRIPIGYIKCPKNPTVLCKDYYGKPCYDPTWECPKALLPY